MSVPEWRKVAQDLEARIEAGEFETGWLPTLPQLRTHYGLGQSTIQRALSDLAAKGVIVYDEGRGYRMGDPP